MIDLVEFFDAIPQTNFWAALFIVRFLKLKYDHLLPHWNFLIYRRVPL